MFAGPICRPSATPATSAPPSADSSELGKAAPIDDHRAVRHDEPIDLYEVIRQRYEHGSTIITIDHSWCSSCGKCS